MASPSDHAARRGVFAATAAYLLWGMFPLYIKLLANVPSLQVLAHRALWCAAVVWAWLALRGDAQWWRGVSMRMFGILCFTTILVSFNWGLYIWAVNAGHVVETSLGYYITPLVSVLFGVLLLRERPNPWQWLAIAAAAVGVASLAVNADRLPWIAIGLAVSFGTYGLIRKLVPVEALQGLAFESALAAIPSLAYLLWCESQGTNRFLHTGTVGALLLLSAGIATATPLALFTWAARRIPMLTLGFLQYLAPTIQLLLGVFVYHEPFGAERKLAFGLIWVALAIYSVDSIVRTVRGGARAPGIRGSASR